MSPRRGDKLTLFTVRTELVRVVELSRPDAGGTSYRVEVFKCEPDAPFAYYSRCWRIESTGDDWDNAVSWRELRKCVAIDESVDAVVEKTIDNLERFLAGTLARDKGWE